MPGLLCFLFLAGFCAAKDTAVFYGGSLSFVTFRDHTDNDTAKVHLKLLTGWKTGKGPCGLHCPRSRTRTSTLHSRKSMLLAKGQEYFGTWTLEWRDKHGVVHTNDISPIIAANLTEKVESVNPMAEWELDTADVFVPIPEEIQYVDIIYEGHSWLELTLNKLRVQPPNWHMQVKVYSHSRSDTMQPNRSPVVQMKPFFKLGMNRTYNIHLTAVDEDDDAIFCRFSKYVEAGSAISEHRLPDTVVDEESCSITVDTSDSTIFMENSTGVIAVTVIDYARHLIALDGEDYLKTPYKHMLSAITVQFLVVMVEHADEPMFVGPTLPNRQAFTIYLGSEFSVDFYARTTSADTSRKIVLFDITRIGGKVANYSGITHQERGRKAKISVSLVLTEEDIGKDILCARAEDNEGLESVNMHCFPITVKPYSRTSQRTIKGVPFFVSFPEPETIVCPEDAYCIFPIYAASTLNGGITNITISSTEALSAVVVGGLRQVDNSYGPETKMIQVQLKEHKSGHLRICFEAADAGSRSTKCLLANILGKDPCASIPCLNGGACIASLDRKMYSCHCRGGYSGKTCEQAPPSPCLTQPCHNGGRCITLPRGSFFCLCSGTYTGSVCASKIDPCVSNPCNEHSVCVGGDDGSASCVCTANYAGTGCNRNSSIQASTCIDGSPDDCADPAALINVCSDPSTAIFCEKSCGLCECKNSTCSNDGICNAHTKPVTCLCEIGFRGKRCENFRTLQQISFTSPTPEVGSIITCDVQLFKSIKSTCRIAAYLHASGIPNVIAVADQAELQAKIVNVDNSTLPGLRDVYLVEVELDRQTNLYASEYYTVCLNASLKSEKVYRCFTVIFKNLLYTNTRYNEESVFLPPTPEKQTRFMCEKGKECHIIVYTTVNNTLPSKCQQVLVMDALGAISFTPRLGNGKCITDVSLTNTSTEGLHNLCIKSWARGESRCYYVDIVRNLKDDCNPNPCSNGGLCTTNTNSSLTFSCLCPPGYSGKTCAEGACPSNSACRNGAYCYTNGTNEKCFCRIGYRGANCEIESREISVNGQSMDQAFTDLALPMNVSCYIKTLCHIVFAISDSSGQSPHLQEGHVSDGIKIVTTGVEKHWTSGSTYKVVIGLRGDSAGDKRVCIQLANNSRIQETCVNVIMIENKNIFPVLKDAPYFVQPTLPNNTDLRCATHDPCHIPLWTSNIIGNDNCPYVTADKTEEDGLYMFNVTRQPNQCEVDASIFSHKEENIRICFTAHTEYRYMYYTEWKGERRCFNIAFVSSLTASPCSGTVCLNGGFCDSSSNLANCICPLGFSGNICEKSPGNTQSVSKTPVYSDLAIPKKVFCKVSQTCDIPFSIRQTTERPEFHLSSHEDLAVYGPFIQKNLTFSNTSIGYIRVTPQTPGNHTACLKLQVSGRNEEDKFCVTVESQRDGTNGQGIIQNMPHFISPTLPDGSEMVCLPGTTCHSLLYISNGIQGGCSGVTVIGNSTFRHIFPPTTIDTQTCSVDVAIISPLNQTETDYVCFDLSTPMIPAERRCFTINYVQVSGSQMTLPCDKSCGLGSNGPTQCSCTVVSSTDGCSNKEVLVRIAFP